MSSARSRTWGLPLPTGKVQAGSCTTGVFWLCGGQLVPPRPLRELELEPEAAQLRVVAVGRAQALDPRQLDAHAVKLVADLLDAARSARGDGKACRGGGRPGAARWWRTAPRRH